jgi:hypothetical protein
MFPWETKETQMETDIVSLHLTPQNLKAVSKLYEKSGYRSRVTIYASADGSDVKAFTDASPRHLRDLISYLNEQLKEAEAQGALQ